MKERNHKKTSSTTVQWNYVQLSLAAFGSLIFALYLYNPHFKKVRDLDNLIVINLTIASLGCYLLSRRWISSFIGSLSAAAVYGFGPYMLGLAKCHPTAGLLAASIPWLFLPSAYAFKKNLRPLRWPFALLPFAAIIVFFQICLHMHFFAVPKRIHLNTDGLIGLLAPLVAAKLGSVGVLIGFYHIPIAALVIGLAMSIAAQRYPLFTIPVAALVLTLSRPVLAVSPVMWLSIPMVFFAVIIGLGVQGIVIAGPKDKKWIILAASVMAALSIFSLLLATKYFQVFLGLAFGYARLFLEAGKIYALGAVVMAIIFVLMRLEIRAGFFRRILLAAVLALDVFLGATFIIDKVL